MLILIIYHRFLQLIRRRHLLFSESHSHDQLPDKMHMLTFDYSKLQSDVVHEFVLGKPLITDNIDKIRILFKFRKPMAVAVGIGISKADVDLLSSCLPGEFKVHYLL